MKSRIISTIVLWIALITPILIWGAQAGIWLIAACSILTQLELYKLLERAGYEPLKKVGLSLGFLIIPLTYYYPTNFGDGAFAPCFLAIIVLMCSLLIQPHRDYAVRHFFPTLFGFIFVPFMLQSFALILRHYSNKGLENEGIMLCFWIIAVAKFTDVGALLIGKKIGKTKLAPTISPNKTWEGVVGGIIVAIMVGMFLFITFNKFFPESFKVWHVGIIAVPIAIAGIISDLIESVIKRQADSKDSGGIIPGIGGMFDLMDSLLLGAPVGYLLITIFID